MSSRAQERAQERALERAQEASKQAKSMQARRQAHKHARKQVSKQASKNAGKHLGGIQSEPCPVGACLNRILDLIFLHFPEKSVFGSQELEESLISLMSLHPRNLAFFRIIICKQIFPVVKNHETK